VETVLDVEYPSIVCCEARQLRYDSDEQRYIELLGTDGWLVRDSFDVAMKASEAAGLKDADEHLFHRLLHLQYLKCNEQRLYCEMEAAQLCVEVKCYHCTFITLFSSVNILSCSCTH